MRNLTSVSWTTLTLSLLVGAGSCGSSSTPPPAAPAAQPASADASPSGAPAGPVDFDAKSKDEKKKYMKETVLPKMQELFAAADPKKFAKVTCMTCHGEGVEEGKFDMPNPKLPKIPGTPDGFKAWVGKHPEMAEFMMKKVKPTMAGLLGMPEYGPDNPKGFGCMECHTVEK